jgi:hypothetical protein
MLNGDSDSPKCDAVHNDFLICDTFDSKRPQFALVITADVSFNHSREFFGGERFGQIVHHSCFK